MAVDFLAILCLLQSLLLEDEWLLLRQLSLSIKTTTQQEQQQVQLVTVGFLMV